MTSENYRQLLNAERDSLEMTKDDFDNTLMNFAMLFHKEQLILSGVVKSFYCVDYKKSNGEVKKCKNQCTGCWQMEKRYKQ